MKCYKLTDANGCSYGGTQWGEGVTHTATSQGMEFCTPDLIHLYSHPLLAVLLNRIHANYEKPLLWEAKAEIVASDYGLKLGAKSVTTIRTIPLPQVTLEQRVTFGILAALEVYSAPAWTKWAQGWLDSSDRSRPTAGLAMCVVRAEAEAAAEAAASAAKAAAWAGKAQKPLDLVALAKTACGLQGTPEWPRCR